MINLILDHSVPVVLVLVMAGIANAQQGQGDIHRDHQAVPGREDQWHPDPPLPEGLTLDEVLDYAENPPPASWPKPLHDNAVYAFTLIELFEYRFSNEGRDELGWDVQGWVGNDDHKFWWKTEGDAIFDGADEGGIDLQAFYAMPLSAFWYLQVGVRYEQAWEPGSLDERFSAALGIQGFAPYKFDLEPTLYLTDDGDVMAQLTASYDLYITQRLVLQPRIELSASAQDIPESDLGAGVHGADFDFRLRYEISREFAPYIGVRYSTVFGETADISSRNGDEDHDLLFIVGARIAF